MEKVATVIFIKHLDTNECDLIMISESGKRGYANPELSDKTERYVQTITELNDAELKIIEV